MLRNGEKACYSVYVESRGAVMDKALQARATSGSTHPVSNLATQLDQAAVLSPADDLNTSETPIHVISCHP